MPETTSWRVGGSGVGIGDLGHAVLGEQVVEGLAEERLNGGIGVGGEPAQLAPDLRRKIVCDADLADAPGLGGAGGRVGRGVVRRCGAGALPAEPRPAWSRMALRRSAGLAGIEIDLSANGQLDFPSSGRVAFPASRRIGFPTSGQVGSSASGQVVLPTSRQVGFPCSGQADGLPDDVVDVSAHSRREPSSRRDVRFPGGIPKETPNGTGGRAGDCGDAEAQRGNG